MINLLLAIIYIIFISLGLPDSILGSAWPSMYPELNIPISYAGLIAMIIALGTIISSLLSDRTTKKFGSGLVTALSVFLTAIALFGFSISKSFWVICLWAIPYGLGAGGVDASLNNYVALHFKSRHMSWLHCMWGVGASIGPYIMSYALTNNLGWNRGYLIISIIQIVLSVIIFLSLPLWKKRSNEENVSINKDEEKQNKPLGLKNIIKIKGAIAIMITFFCYCALEQTAGLWASSYLVLKEGIDKELAASYASLFFIGITAGRAINGFLTFKFSDKTMIHSGMVVILLGILMLFIPNSIIILIGLILVGLGCAPIYPCIIHSTPSNFGKDKSQALIGVQMASAYLGTLLMPPLFGLIANNISISLFPYYLLVILVIMFMMYERLNKIIKNKDKVIVNDK